MPSPVLPSGSLPVMPLSASSFDSFDNSKHYSSPINIKRTHPHPLRSHYSSEDIMAEPSHQHSSIDWQQGTDKVFISGASERPLPRRSSISSARVRRSPSVTQVPPTIFRTSSRLCYAPSDYPVIPVRPPLKPTVSFGGVSQYTVDSTDSVYEQKVFVGMEDREVPDCNISPAMAKWKIRACVVCLCLLNFVVGYGTTALSTALPHVSSDLDLSGLQSFWLPASFLTLTSLTQPLFMRLSQALGYKALLLSGLVLFSGGSIISSAAHSINSILVGRCLEGIGAGAVSMLTQSTTNQILEVNRRRLKGLIALAFWLGLGLGPIIGGAMAQTVGWRGIFYLQACLTITGLVIASLSLYLPLIAGGSPLNGLGQVDFLGWVLLAAGITSTVAAISLGGVLHPWISWQTLVPLLAGISIFAVWAIYNRFRLDPLMPISLFRNGSATVTCFGTVIHGALITAVVYVLPTFFEISGFNPVISGLCLAPWTLGLMITSSITAFGIRIAGYRMAIWLGWALTTLVIGLLLLAKDDSSLTVSIPILLLGGIAMGMLAASLPTAIRTTASNDDEVIHAEPIHLFLSTLGQGLGIVLSSTVFLNGLDKEMTRNPALTIDADDYSHHAISLLLRLPGMDPFTKTNVISSYFAASQNIWIFFCIASGVALFLSVWFTEDYRPLLKRHNKLELPPFPELE